MRVATEADKKPGQLVAVIYINKGLDWQCEPFDYGYIFTLPYNEVLKVYAFTRIDRIDENNHIWLTSGSGIGGMANLAIPNDEEAENFLMVEELTKELMRKNPGHYKTADEQVDYSYKIDNLVMKALKKKFNIITPKKPKRVNFEKVIIDTILNTIKGHQVYLTQKENLPQLAKLGYMYNTLWYAGRVCFGYDGVIKKGNQCEDNPKYKIEMCDPDTEEIENYIYDAWGMHVSNEEDPTTWDSFKKIVLEGKTLSQLEIDLRKPNKTFDEWVAVLTNPEYRYHGIYPNRKSVANHLLCVIGNGYGFKDGFVISKASGADMDEAEYGEWENAIFHPDIQRVVNEIMTNPIVEEAMNAYHAQVIKWGEKRKEERKDLDSILERIAELSKTNPEFDAKMREREEAERNEYHKYYPICKYSVITKIDKDTHPSYIKAAIEICEEIIANAPKEDKSNYRFATKHLNIFKQYGEQHEMSNS